MTAVTRGPGVVAMTVGTPQSRSRKRRDLAARATMGHEMTPETWHGAIESMAAEWAGIESRVPSAVGAPDQVAEWAGAIPSMINQYLALRHRGAWVSGPSDFFGVLRLDRSEQHHSMMLAWLMNPDGRHGLGRAFIDCLVRPAAEITGSTGFRVSSIELEVARSDTRADIVVWGDGTTVIIENKVDAGEQPAQCDRLFAHFCDEPGATFIFLTPRGRAPRTATDEAAEAFVPVSYSRVASCLRGALESTASHSAARTVAENYLRTLEVQFG